MKKEDVPMYFDPDDFEDMYKNIKYPCSTNLMVYNPLLHRYYLTVEALETNRIDVDRGEWGSVAAFIEEVTEDIYGVMMHLAPFNYEYNCYLVAKSFSRQFPDRYAARKQFEKALIYQAQYKLRNIDVRDFSGVDIENGRSIERQTLHRELRHISPKALDILRGLGVLFNGNIPGKYLVNYRENM